MTALDQTRMDIIQLVMTIDDIGQLTQLHHQAVVLQQHRSKEEQEKELLLELNQQCVLSEQDWSRFEVLREKRNNAALTQLEQQELAQLIQAEEQLRLRRVHLLGQIAQLRDASLMEVTESLELQN